MWETYRAFTFGKGRPAAALMDMLPSEIEEIHAIRAFCPYLGEHLIAISLACSPRCQAFPSLKVVCGGDVQELDLSAGVFGAF